METGLTFKSEKARLQTCSLRLSLVTSHTAFVGSAIQALAMSKPRLEGKVAIITGAASGIGEAAARLFVENGARVIIADVQDELGQQVAASIGSDKCCYKRCDVRDEQQVEATVAFAVDKYGRLDVMYSNAGIGGPNGGIMDLDLKELDNTMAVNFRGAVAAIKHASRAMVANRIRGSIICTASVSATVAGLGPHAYTVSKHAIVGLARSATAELGKHGIRVNCVSPFGVPTPLSCGISGCDASAMEAQTAAISNLKGIILKPRNIAEAALFLASDESAFISGHDLVVDGGYTVVDYTCNLYK